MRSTDLDEPVFNWNTLMNTMNYGIVGEYLTWLQENWEDLGKLENDWYWRTQMNPEEQEMAKHANRSSAWLPERLRDRRNALVKAMFLYLEKREVEKRDTLWSIHTTDDSCFQCGTSTREIEDYVHDFKDRIDYENVRDYYSDRFEYDKVAEKIAKQMATDYSVRMRIAANPYLPSYGSQYVGYNFHWDLCSACYTKTMARMQRILSKDLNRWRKNR
jgi:hypothetical protein